MWLEGVADELTLQGPLQDMSEAELTHWMRCASLRAAVVASPGAADILQRFGERRARLSHHFKVLILPQEDSEPGADMTNFLQTTLCPQ